MSVTDLNSFRKKLKPTSVALLEKNDQELSKELGKKQNNRSGDFLPMVEGRNLYRIFPPHDEVDENGFPNPYAEPVVVSYLPFYYTEKDTEGKEIIDPATGKPKKKLSVKSVFHSRIHGKRDKNNKPLVSKDLIEEFVRLSVDRAKVLYPDDEAKRHHFARGIFGKYSPNKADRINGILYRDGWVCYAKKLEGGEKLGYGRFEMNKSVKNRSNKIGALESANEPLGTDPFTHPDEGRALLVIYDKQESKAQNERKPEDYYTVSLDTTTENVTIEGGRTVKVNVTRPLTDDDLTWFMSVDPLAKIYRGVFTRRDFNIQLLGLQILDSQYEMGVFDSPEFQAIAEEISQFYVEENDSTDTVADESAPLETSTAPAVQKEYSEEELLKLMSRAELKDYIKDNELPIIVKPAAIMDDDVLRGEILSHLSLKKTASTPAVTEVTSPAAEVTENTTTEETVTAEAQVPGGDHPETVTTETATEGTAPTAAQRLALLREQKNKAGTK